MTVITVNSDLFPEKNSFVFKANKVYLIDKNRYTVTRYNPRKPFLFFFYFLQILLNNEVLVLESSSSLDYLILEYQTSFL